MTKPVFDPDDDPSQTRAVSILTEEERAQMQRNKGKGRAMRPRDAATLVLFRDDDDTPRILMGCRSRGHDFMPDKFVFPGGRVDTEDGRVPSLTELQTNEESAVAFHTRRRPRAFPLTAIRETYEETGLIVGREAEPVKTTPESWSEYYNHGVAPDLKKFTFIGRAVTPPMRHKRFDARFFLANANDVLVDDRAPVDGAELNGLRWFTLKEAAGLDLPNVTRYVISEVEQRLMEKADLRPFFLRWAPTGHLRERIEPK